MPYLNAILQGILTVMLVMAFYYYGKRRGKTSGEIKMKQQAAVIVVAAAVSALLVFLGYNKTKYPYKLWITYMLTVTVLTGLIGLADGWKSRKQLNREP